MRKTRFFRIRQTENINLKSAAMSVIGIANKFAGPNYFCQLRAIPISVD